MRLTAVAPWFVLLSGAAILATCGGCSATQDAAPASTQPAATRSFELDDVLPAVTIGLDAGGCDDDPRLVCTGPLTVTLGHADGTVHQTIEMPTTYLELGDDGQPETAYDGLYGRHQPVLYAEDLNFDGQRDLVVRNGNNGSYYGPSYDVFLDAGDTFRRSAALSDLASSGLNRPEVDPEARTLTLFDKNGCCEHDVDVYSIVGDEPVRIAGADILEDLFRPAMDWREAIVPAAVCGGSGDVQLHDATAFVSSATWPDAWNGSTDPVVANQVEIRAEPPLVRGDVDGDGQDDTVLSVWCTNGGGTAGGQLGNALAVYRGSDDRALLGIVTTTQGDPFELHAPYFEAGATVIGTGTVTVTEPWYGPDDITAVPTGRAVTTWTFDGHTLVPGTPAVPQPG